MQASTIQGFVDISYSFKYSTNKAVVSRGKDNSRENIF